MTAEEFWNIIAASRMGLVWGPGIDAEEVRDQQLERFPELIGKLSVEEVRSFEDHFDDLMNAAYSKPQEGLWGVAFDIAGGCSEDMFEDFRAWLISMGREVYEAAIQNADTIYDVADRDDLGDEIFFEELIYVPAQVLRARQGGSG